MAFLGEALHRCLSSLNFILHAMEAIVKFFKGERDHVACKMLWLSEEGEDNKWAVEDMETTMATEQSHKQHFFKFVHNSFATGKVMK